MTPESLKAWRLSLKPEWRRRTVSKAEAARRLGVGYRTYCRWEEPSEEGGTDMLTDLACAAVKWGLPPYE